MHLTLLRDFRTGRRLVASFAMVWLWAGCLAFREGELLPSEPWPISQVTEGQAISVEVGGTFAVNGRDRPMPLGPHYLDLCRKQTLKAYRESGLFRDVQEGASGGQLRAEVQIFQVQTVTAWRDVLATLTFALSPTSQHETVELRTVFTDELGNPLGTFEMTARISTIYQFFLIFAPPTRWPSSVHEDALYELNRATLLEAHARGLL